MKTVRSTISTWACAWSLIASLSLVTTACTSPEEPAVPKKYLPEKKMVDMLVDIHIVEGAKVGRRIMSDTLLADVYFAKVYDKHGVSKDEFTRSFEYYSSKPAMMNKVYEKVLDSLNKVDVQAFQQMEADTIGSISEEGILIAPADTISNTKP